jgi:hypothetical protein
VMRSGRIRSTMQQHFLDVIASAARQSHKKDIFFVVII